MDSMGDDGQLWSYHLPLRLLSNALNKAKNSEDDMSVKIEKDKTYRALRFPILPFSVIKFVTVTSSAREVSK
jgi:hypothetical protein